MKTKISDLLIVSDMDGTLLNSKLEISKADLDTIRLFTSMGGRFSIATGRVAESAGKYGELMPYLSPSITSGGTVIYDYSKEEILDNISLNFEVGNKVLRDVLAAFPEVGSMVASSCGRVFQTSANDELYNLFVEENITYYVHPKDEMPKEWNKILFAGSPDLLAFIQDFVSSQFYPDCSFIMTAPVYFEVLPQNANKGTALKQLCKILNVRPENSYAIGNYYNDIDLMNAAGHSVAMGNSPEDLLKISDSITADCDNAGVGQFIYRLIREINS